MSDNLEFNKNEDQFGQLLTKLQARRKKIFAGGGEKKIEEQHARGKLTARERIAYLIDPSTEFLEIGRFAADDMYEEYGGCPSAGVVTGIGQVSGRLCVIVANDATVKAGAWFPMTAKRIFARRRSPWKTGCRSFTWSTARGSSFPCRMRSSLTATTSAVNFATTRSYRLWVSCRLQPSWETVSQAARTSRSCRMRR